jgi:hypothetical protein
MAQSTSCPGCHKPVIVEDFILKKNKPSLLMVTKVQTCGRIVVPRRARIVAKLVEAHGGIEVQGHLEADQVISGRCTLIDAKAYWRGNLKAPAVIIKPQAVIESGYFEVPDDSLGLSTLSDESAESLTPPEPKNKSVVDAPRRKRVTKKKTVPAKKKKTED